MERDLIISSQLININKVRFFLDEIFAQSCLNRSYFNHVFLGLSEAVQNAIVHGNGMDAAKIVLIYIKYFEKQLFIEVKDEGDGFHVDCNNDPTCFENLKKEHGRGIFFLRQIADEVKYFDGGRAVLIKYILS